MDRKKIYDEIYWLNWKNYFLVYIPTAATFVLIALYSGVFLPVGWLGFILGAVCYLLIVSVQRRMARKLTDKIMKMHREDYTVHVDIRSGLPERLR